MSMDVNADIQKAIKDADALNYKHKFVKTSFRDYEDIDLFCNTLNAEAGRVAYTDPYLRRVLLRAQELITLLYDHCSDEAKEALKEGR